MKDQSFATTLGERILTKIPQDKLDHIHSVDDFFKYYEIKIRETPEKEERKELHEQAARNYDLNRSDF